KLAEIANTLSCQLEGDGEIDIHGIATLQEAEPGQLSFLTNQKYIQQLQETRASAIIVGQNFSGLAIPLLKSENPYLTFAKALELFHPEVSVTPHIHPSAIISDKAELGKGISIGAYSVIGDGVRLGDGVIIEPHCTIHRQVRIGDFSKILSGSV